MSSLYLHIPYCRQACIYCNFHFSTGLKTMPAMLEAMLTETERRKEYLQGETLETIYLGGGTPSLLPQADLEKLLDKIHKTFQVSKSAEITLEANPDDLSSEKLQAFRQLGINRLSIGVQSFGEQDLQWLKRIHNSKQALDSIRAAQEAGIPNISIDLIYGIPGQSVGNWEDNLARLKTMDIPHFSAYSLTVEPRTALSGQVRAGKLLSPDDELSAAQFLFLQDWCENNGYEAYEISNYSRPGMRSRHNSAYWQSKKYLGIGPSAHSFDGISRQWNLANNALYIKALKNNEPFFEKEILTPEQKHNEYILTRLRTAEGINLDHSDEMLYEPLKHQWEPILQDYISRDMLKKINGRIFLTATGKLWADRIAADLFI